MHSRFESAPRCLDRDDATALVAALALPAFVVVPGPDARFIVVAANDRLSQALAIAAPVAGRAADEVFPEDAVGALETGLERCLDASAPASWEIRMRARNEDRWWQLDGAALGGGPGSASGILVTVVDVTARHAAERALATSRTRLHALLRSVPAGIALRRKDGDLALCNGRYAGLFPDAAPAAIAHAGDGAREPDGHDRHHLEGGRRVVSEKWIIDGGETLEVLVDVTEASRLRRLGRRGRVVASALTEAVDDLVAVVIAPGIVVAINAEGARLLGAEVPALVGRTVASAFGGTAAEPLQSLIEEAFGSQAERRAELAWNDRSLAVSVRPLANGGHAPAAALLVGRDVTPLRRAEARAREVRHALSRYMRIADIGEMAAALAHEVNQPIAAVVNYCRGVLLRLEARGDADRELAGALNEACREAERASELVRTIAGFVRDTPDQRSVVDINQVIGAAVALIRTEFERGEVALTLDLAPGHVPVAVNPVEVEQVVLNLLKNALDAVRAGGRSDRRIVVRSACDGEGVHVSVEDSGNGFPASIRERVFTPFFTTKPGGMGMGLAICQAIVESHGGRIRAGTGNEGGASVQFTLPLEGAKHAA